MSWKIWHHVLLIKYAGELNSPLEHQNRLQHDHFRHLFLCGMDAQIYIPAKILRLFFCSRFYILNKSKERYGTLGLSELTSVLLHVPRRNSRQTSTRSHSASLKKICFEKLFRKIKSPSSHNFVPKWIILNDGFD